MAQLHFSPVVNDYTPCVAVQGQCKYGSANHISTEAYKALKEGSAYDKAQNTSKVIALRTLDSSGKDKAQVAPDGLQGVYCRKCSKYFDAGTVDKLLVASSSSKNKPRCPTCNEITLLEDAGVDVRFKDAHLLMDENVRKASWFHVTTNDDWLEDMSTLENGTPLLHIGSKEAAMDRLRDLMKWQNDGSTWYLYELKIKPEASISEGLFNDENDDCPSSEAAARKTNYDGTGVNRYLNTYEAPGTISLVANPHALREVQRVTIPTT